MTTKRSTNSATMLRHCIGSTRFGIEPHEAPIGDFPKQPSQPDGLRSDVQAPLARVHQRAPQGRAIPQGQERSTTEPLTGSDVQGTGTATSSTKAGSKARRPSKPTGKADAVERAEALIVEVDALPADQHVKRVGEADVQAALETSAASRMLAD